MFGSYSQRFLVMGLRAACAPRFLKATQVTPVCSEVKNHWSRPVLSNLLAASHRWHWALEMWLIWIERKYIYQILKICKKVYYIAIIFMWWHIGVGNFQICCVKWNLIYINSLINNNDNTNFTCFSLPLLENLKLHIWLASYFHWAALNWVISF